MKYTLPKLPYAYHALEPYIDEATMKVHHQGHHKAYVEKLNAALEGHPEWQRPVEELMRSLDSVPQEIRKDVRNNGGGHANHSFFWKTLTPGGQTPGGSVASAIKKKFGSVESFKKKFAKKAEKHFSNGWAWLCVDASGDLVIKTLKDHLSPLSLGLHPLMVLDLWEHAYYLKHKNLRPDYIKAFWKILDWAEVERRFQKAPNKD